MRKFAICIQTLIPVRINPSERAEMVSQIIFGELYYIIEMLGKWAKIKMAFDSYEGWIDKKTVFEIDQNLFHKFDTYKNTLSQKIISPLKNISQNSIIPLVAGSSLPFINDAGFFEIDSQKFHYKHKTPLLEPTPVTIAQTAKQFENAPYLWGGRTVLGIDCSGFTQIVYKMAGISLHRDASMQADQGRSVNFINEAQSGDLAFFDNTDGKIIHVGIILSSIEIIHASGTVRIDSIDNEGIFNSDTHKYSHKLRIIKRILT